MDFQRLLYPKTLAVIGVSKHNDMHPANVIYYKNLLRYPVTTYAVNPKAGLLKGQHAYRNVKEIPEKIDLAVIVSRADNVPSIMEDCIEAEVGGAVIVSGGFSEVGRTDLQERIIAIAKEGSFPFIGPNCLGILTPNNVDTFFFPSERVVTPDEGNVALISQSGGVLVDQTIRCRTEGVGISAAISIGNKAHLKEADLIEYLGDDPKTKVIGFYIEGFGKGEGKRFLEAASKSKKPIVVMKPGKSPIASKAISSHTASMAGDHSVLSSIFKQHGIVEASNPEELLHFSEALSRFSQPVKGNVGIITVSGGHGVIASDMCSEMKLKIPAFTPEQQEKIRSGVSSTAKDIATYTNPVDLTGSAIDNDVVAAAMEIGMIDSIDCILVLLLPYVPGVTMDLGAMLAHVYARTRKPIIAYVPRVEKYQMLIEGFEMNGLPVAHTLEGAVQMASALMRYHKAL
ncbi:MAG: CoA-binding protein [Desulfomonilia bacterium]|jgi:acyl-CoA synthetase (NDP forming)|uniref:Succinyl-CoA ligase (ADP-forming) subunit alpha n=1 Tax=anaerobic digester metagenome TaxID=1263854 RepID=A0A485M4E1_9ZZZZ|nr:CoA-binding protein [Pseudomonadota bacterium]HRS54827.1 CoA-binding protein [Desulfomonilia bacterium]HRV34418.1 CoA-binding protein [Desulfomonilia bacterium]